MAGTQSTEAADLESGYSDLPTATPEVQEPVEQATNEAEVQAAPVATPEPTPAPFDAQAEFRRLNDTMQGRIGDLNRQLQQALKAKEEAEKPAPTPAPRFKRVTDNYPELAEQLAPDIEERILELGKAPDPKQLQELIDQGVARKLETEVAALREAQVTDRHEHWKSDLWVDGKLGTARTPEYQAWLKTMPEADGKAFESSNNPYFVARKIDQFYEWKKAQAASKTPEPQRIVSTRQKRLEAAVTPRGTGGHATGGSTELEDMEAGYR